LTSAHVDAERVAVVEVVVERGGEHVVGSGDGVEVAGEMQVDLVHRHDLRAAAAGAAALEPERRPDRGLAERDHRALARAAQGLAEADGHRGLAVAGRRRRDRGHEHELAVGAPAARLEGLEQHLGLGAAVGKPLVLGEAEVGGDGGDGSRRASRGGRRGRGRHRA
jgi:hypothetical protein